MIKIVKKTYYWGDDTFDYKRKDLIDLFVPHTHKSNEYMNWIAVLDLRTCLICRNNHGKIYKLNELPTDVPEVHVRCRCRIVEMDAVFAGNATQDGINGADYVIKNTGSLPDYYIDKKQPNSWAGFRHVEI